MYWLCTEENGHGLRDNCKEKLVDGRGKQVRWRERRGSLTKNIKKLTMVRPWGPTLVTRLQWKMLYGQYFTIHSPQIACNNTNFVQVGSGLGASIIVHLPRQLPPLTHHPSRYWPSSVQDLRAALSPRTTWWMDGCVLEVTQNQNESFNSTIWQRCPKSEFCSATIVEIAVNLTVISFNAGPGSLLCSSPGTAQCHSFYTPCSTFLPRTITGCLHQWWSAGDEKRQALHLDRVTLEEQQVEEDGETYGAGWHWRSSKWRKMGRRMVLGDFEGV